MADAVLNLNVYGLPIEITGDWPDVLDDLGSEFWWFRADPGKRPRLRLGLELSEPQLERFGDLTSAFVTPRNVVYQGEQLSVIEYFGRAIIVIDRETGDATVQGTDASLVREAASNFLISRIGEHLNRRGFVRLHSLGLSVPAGAITIAMPSGGGKSTLALRALEDDRCKILSEDTPLLDGRGLVHPFPLRIGINPTDSDRVPADVTVRTIERIEFHPKLALDVETFADRIEREARPLRHLVIGSRTLASEGRLERLDRRRALGPLLREAVVGVGVYQGMEFVLQSGWRDVFGKSGTAARRARVASVALRQAEVWGLELGRDRDSNWAALEPLFGE